MIHYAQFCNETGKHVGYVGEDDIANVNETYFSYRPLPEGFNPDVDQVEGSVDRFKVIWGDLPKQQAIVAQYPPSKQINIMREALVSMAKQIGTDCPALMEMDAFINNILGDEND